jgi:hypothetical protein
MITPFLYFTINLIVLLKSDAVQEVILSTPGDFAITKFAVLQWEDQFFWGRSEGRGKDRSALIVEDFQAIVLDEVVIPTVQLHVLRFRKIQVAKECRIGRYRPMRLKYVFSAVLQKDKKLGIYAGAGTRAVAAAISRPIASISRTISWAIATATTGK